MPLPRIAVRSDAKALSILAERTFRETFAADNKAADMDLYCSQSYNEAVQAAEIDALNMTTFVRGDGAGFAGFAQVSWASAPACVEADSPGEIRRFYVLAAWHGRGIAQELMTACLDAFHQRGTDVAWLGVWERNPRAIAFYGKCGFAAVGEHAFTLGTDVQRDIIMARPLARRG